MFIVLIKIYRRTYIYITHTHTHTCTQFSINPRSIGNASQLVSIAFNLYSKHFIVKKGDHAFQGMDLTYYYHFPDVKWSRLVALLDD